MRRREWLFGLAILCGCGPSFQALYEGDARFEHCYALDDTGTESMQKRADCWRDWVDHYTFGQTRDRVQYAANRYRALTSTALPTDEGMMSAAPGGAGGAAGSPALAPTNAFAPPPTTASAQPTATSTWMTTAPQAIEPDPPRDGGVPIVAPADGHQPSAGPATSTSAFNPTVLPPPPPPPMGKSPTSTSPKRSPSK